MSSMSSSVSSGSKRGRKEVSEGALKSNIAAEQPASETSKDLSFACGVRSSHR